MPPRKRAQQPPLSRFTDEACIRKPRHVYCDEMAAWINKISLGTEVGVGTGDIVIRREKRKIKKIETTAAKYNGLPYSIGRP